ncbi:MAG TPA: antibiotic biosynthesis monooxygenase [Chondromyces sp.]|nr:antibiotic biosynthesis monooxygenase [Chondromyces sp.]
MYIYLTSGTYDFLKTIKQKHTNETMILMENPETAMLVHETEHKSVFQTPRRYEVLDSSGQLAEHGLIVFNNIPVTDEGRPVFEYRFKNRAGMIENSPGFQAFRVLRPLDGNTYIIMTQWKDKQSFEAWKTSQSFKKAHGQGKEPGVDHGPKIFSSPSYVTTYTVPSETNES